MDARGLLHIDEVATRGQARSGWGFMSTELKTRLSRLHKIVTPPSKSASPTITQVSDQPARERTRCLKSLRAADRWPRHYDLILSDFATATEAVAWLIHYGDPASLEFGKATQDCEEQFSVEYSINERRSPLEYLSNIAESSTVARWNASQDSLLGMSALGTTPIGRLTRPMSIPKRRQPTCDRTFPTDGQNGGTLDTW